MPSSTTQPSASPSPSRAIPSQAALVGVIAAGGALGATLRWAIGRLVSGETEAVLAAALTTGTINVVGSLALGIIAGLNLRARRPLLTAFTTVGLLGGFTTFSTAMLDTAALADGSWWAAPGYLASTTVAAVLAAGAGLLAADRLRNRRRPRSTE